MKRHTADFQSRYDRFPAPFGKRVDGFTLWFAFIGLMIAIGIAVSISNASDPSWSHQGGIAVWTDAATGCRYTQSDAGMQPLVGPDGRPDCQRRPQ